MTPARKKPDPVKERRGTPQSGDEARGGSGRLDLWLAGAAVAAVFVLVTAGAFQRIWATDFWWQYRAGRLIASSGIPSVDTFSFTAAGNPWIELRWIYCLVLHLSIKAAGFPAAVVLKWLAILASFSLVTAAAATRRTLVLACGVLTVAVLASSQRFFVRPELGTFLFFAFFLWVIGRFTRGETRLIWALPAVQVLWVNTHTLFILGPLLVGLLLLVTSVEYLDHLRGSAAPADRGRTSGMAATIPATNPPGVSQGAGQADRASLAKAALASRLRTLAIVVAATALACLVNPYGVKSFGFAWLLLQEVHGSVFKDVSAELRGPFSFSQSYTALAYYEALLGLALAAAVANIRRLPPFWTLLLLSQLYLSLTAIRNLPLFALAAVPFIVANLAATPLASHRLVAPRLPAARRLLAIAVIAWCALYAWRFVTDRFNVAQGDTNQFGAGIATHRYPEAAERFLAEKKITAPLFNTMLEGGYLLAQDRKVFIDGRLEVYGGPFLGRFLRAQEDPATWKEVVARYRLGGALVDLQSPLVRQLGPSEEWSLAYFDEVAAIFLRRDLIGAPAPLRTRQDFEGAVAALRARLPRPVPLSAGSWLSRVHSPIPYLRVAGFLLGSGQPELAVDFANDALAAWPDTDSAHAMLAHVLEARRDFAGAAREYGEALRIAPDNAVNRRQLAVALFQADRFSEALPALEATVRTIPSDSLSWAMLTRIHADANRPREATTCAERAAALAPRNPDYRKNLGRLYAVSGNIQGAVVTLRRAYRLDPHDFTVCRDLAAMLVKSGNGAEARLFVERGLALKPDDPDLPRILQAIR